MDLRPAGIGGITQKEEQHFHVLAVDDSLLDRKLLERLLTVSSYQVTCVDSGDKALEYLGLLNSKENINAESIETSFSSSTSSSSSSSSSCTATSSPDQPPQQEVSKVNLIITDYSMPGMSGYDLLRRVKGSTWKDIPVVVMSSENVPSRISMCLEGGAEEFLLKPVQLSDMRKLQSHLLKPFSHSCEDLDVNMDENADNDENNNNNNNNDKSSNTNTANKRKGMSRECSERRPKMKELAVV